MQENIDFQRHQLISALGQAAESLRQAASMADGYAAVLAQASSFSPQQASAGLNLNPMAMFQLFSPQGQAAHPAHPAPDAPEPDAAGKKKRKRNVAEKKAKDPNAPKRPPSAYLLFQNEVRKEMRALHPGKPYHELLSKISERWSQMNEAEKKVYNDLTNVSKIQWQEKKAAYDAQLTGANGTAATDIATSPETPTAAPTPAATVAPAAAVAQDSDDDDDDDDASDASSHAAVAAAVAAPSAESDTSGEDSPGSSSDSEEEEVAAPQPPPKKARGAAKAVVAPAAPAPESKKRTKKVQKEGVA